MRTPPRICKWCSRDLGVIACTCTVQRARCGWLYLCPRCDYSTFGGPNEDRVKDQQPRP